MINKTIIANTNKKSIKIHILFYALFSVFFILCTGDNVDTKAKIKVDPLFNETSLFLAGKEIPKNSSLYKYGETNEYKNYSKEINKKWENLQALNVKKITKWKEKNFSGKFNDVIFYPFSGPDILNAHTFFPEGSKYIMFGLESPGEIPHPHKVSQDKLHQGLNGLKKALNSILYQNFFKTIDMGKDISTNEFDSTISVIMFFLGITDHEVVSVSKIWLDESGQIVLVKPQTKSNKIIRGAEIVFRKANEDSIKTVHYFQIDVSDDSLNIRTNFVKYLEGLGRFTTIIKSASYLMHREKEFSKIRNLTLTQSDYLLQDDSGIAFKYFLAKDWKLSFYGIYIKPIQLFASRYQEDFFQAMKKYSKGPLEFSYGYNAVEAKQNLMFAERIKK